MQYKWKVLSNTTVATLMAAIDTNIVLISLPTIGRELPGTDATTLLWILLGYSLLTAVVLLNFGRLSDMFGRRAALRPRVRHLHGRVAPLRVLADRHRARLLPPRPGDRRRLPVLQLGRDHHGRVPAERARAGARDQPGLDRRRGGLGSRARRGHHLDDRLALDLLRQRADRSDRHDPGARRPPRAREPGGATRTSTGSGTSSSRSASRSSCSRSRSGRSGTSDPATALAMGVASGSALLGGLRLRRVAGGRSRCSTSRSSGTRQFSASAIAMLLNALARGAFTFILVFYLQGPPRFLSPFTAGLFLIPVSASLATVGPISGWLSDRYGPRWFLVAGLLVSAVGFLWLATIGPDESFLALAPPLILVGAGMGLFAAPNRAAMMTAVPPGRRGVASGIGTTLLNSGVTISLGVTLIVLSQVLPHAVDRGDPPRIPERARAGGGGLGVPRVDPRGLPGLGHSAARCAGPVRPSSPSPSRTSLARRGRGLTGPHPPARQPNRPLT